MGCPETLFPHNLPSRKFFSRSTETSLLPTLWVGSLIGSGFCRIVLLNGHGGNVIPASEALDRLALERPKAKAPWMTCAT